MKKILIIAVASLFLVACEDEPMPVVLPPPPPLSSVPVAEAADEQELPDGLKISEETAVEAKEEKPVAVPAPAAVAVPAKPRAVIHSDAGQLNAGRYTIQVGVFPSESRARALINKLATDGISAYGARVNNPAQLMGSYHRVRVGFFNERAAAENFGRTRLSVLGYEWWIDRSSNDRLGSPSVSAPVVAQSVAQPKAPEPAPVAPAAAPPAPPATPAPQAPPPQPKPEPAPAPAPPPAPRQPQPQAQVEQTKEQLEKQVAEQVKARQAAAAPPAPAPPPPPAPPVVENAASKEVRVNSRGKVSIVNK
ncbi:MAG: SPOR domain-containing protein [Fibromonadaceae bacterium]|jgi:hypothetical protein|nr:SPOR domain-containing protein [Fibromonadaceae bacterium]